MSQRIQNAEKLPPELETRRSLRQRWELASVLNFLKVFQPVIGNNLKLSAEEIETALINPNDSLAQLHIMLLKGIPPVSKTLNNSDGWITALSKKLTEWWPWVAEGAFPLAVAKGEEKSRYKELDPTVRLMILKALCEIRADQNDAVTYINDSVKKGTEITTFRKDKIGDENGTAYWYEGDSVIGHRLYKEVYKFDPKLKGKGAMPPINSQWETLATNLKEFCEVVDVFSSSEVEVEVLVSETIQAEAITVLEKLEKNKERTLKKKQREEMLLNGFHNSGVTRTCRNRKPVNYTFDEFDKAINDAIQFTKKRKTTQVRVRAEKSIDDTKQDGSSSNTGSDPDSKSNSKSRSGADESTDSETQSDNRQQEQDGDVVDDTSDDQYEEGNSKSNEKVSDTSSSESENKKEAGPVVHEPRGSRWSKRVAGDSNSAHPVQQTGNFTSKNRLRQRPVLNTALDSLIAPDTEDESETSSQSSDQEGTESES